MSTPTLTPRQTFRETVAAVAALAKAKLPTQVNGRVESAVKLVLSHDVEPQADGTTLVGSSTDPLKQYTLAGTSCTCQDFERGQAPAGWCQHRIAAAIQKRVLALLPQSTPVETEPPTAPPSPLPEAPASVNVHLTIAGRQVQLTLRDTDETRLLQRLQAVLAQYPVPEPAQASSQGPPQGPEPGWCALHQCEMPQTTKNGRSWYSHRTPEGWCKGRRR